MWSGGKCNGMTVTWANGMTVEEGPGAAFVLGSVWEAESSRFAGGLGVKEESV